MWKSHCGQINRTWHYKVLRKICWRYLTCYQENRYSCVLNKFNSFDDNLKFTIDTFENCVPHFLDIEICPNGLGIYHKHTQDGQYVNFDSFTLRKWKVSWIRSLVTRADGTGGTRGHVPNGPASLLCLRRTIFFVYCRNISFVSANWIRGLNLKNNTHKWGKIHKPKQCIPVQCQPGPDYPFPMKQFGKKKRSCQASWFKNFSWLHYSKEKDSVFCIFCIRH